MLTSEEEALIRTTGTRPELAGPEPALIGAWKRAFLVPLE